MANKKPSYANMTDEQVEKHRQRARERYHRLTPKQKRANLDRMNQLRKKGERGKKKREYNRIWTKKQREPLKLECFNYKGGKCLDCGLVDHPALFDFHHRDPSQKDFGISQVISRPHSSSEILLALLKPELDKCDLLCCLCHRRRHLSPMKRTPDANARGSFSEQDQQQQQRVETTEKRR